MSSTVRCWLKELEERERAAKANHVGSSASPGSKSNHMTPSGSNCRMNSTLGCERKSSNGRDPYDRIEANGNR